MHQFTFDADKGRTQIEACERLPVGARNTGVTQRTSAGDNSADQTTCSIKIFHTPLIGLTEQAIYTFNVVPFPFIRVRVGGRKTSKQSRKLPMTERCKHIRNVMAEKTNENLTLVVSGDPMALVDRVTYRDPRFARSACAHSPTSCDRQPLESRAVSVYLYSNAPRLIPCPVKSLSRTILIATPLCFGNSQTRVIRFAGDPVREVAARKFNNLDLTLSVEHNGRLSQMGENREAEILLKISAGDETAKQPGESDLYLACFAETLTKNKWGTVTCRFK